MVKRLGSSWAMFLRLVCVLLLFQILDIIASGPSAELIQVVYVTTVDVLPQAQERHSTPRQDAGKARVLKRLSRESGTWGKGHPRWSILEALQAFDHYRNLTGSEIDRLEGLYQHVPKAHKNASPAPPFFLIFPDFGDIYHHGI